MNKKLGLISMIYYHWKSNYTRVSLFLPSLSLPFVKYSHFAPGIQTSAVDAGDNFETSLAV